MVRFELAAPRFPTISYAPPHERCIRHRSTVSEGFTVGLVQTCLRVPTSTESGMSASHPYRTFRGPPEPRPGARFVITERGGRFVPTSVAAEHGQSPGPDPGHSPLDGWHRVRINFACVPTERRVRAWPPPSRAASGWP